MSDEIEIHNIKTLQEIFNITVTEARNTYNYYQKDLNAAIQGLSSTSEVRQGPENRHDGDGAAVFAAPSETASGTTNNNPIDLTSAGSTGEDDLQKALALSLLDMSKGSSSNGGSSGSGATGRGGSGNNQPISQEEQDISRALEASLVDNQSHMNRLGMSYVSYDPLNPHERKREGDTPVGLKNIGNTCWFASVIQSLFYIPQFRDCILNYTAPELPEQLPCVKFVVELQNLFALLLSSNQKYINPKPALDVLRSGVFSDTSGSQQQDVSEFTHKLLEWMENAFAHTQPKDQSNPIVDLFTGQCITEGLLNNEQFVNNSQFGAFPVQIEGHAHLHDSLEAATVNVDMQQETWFTRLPAILVVELSRFKYNQTSGRVEKIHDQLNFDLALLMDRYLHGNCQETRQRRVEVYKLRDKIDKLSKKLKSFTNYNHTPVSLVEVLSLALKFVGSRDQIEGNGYDDEGPTPRSGSASDIITVESSLQQWKAEIESDIWDIQDELKAARDTLDSVYSDPIMNTTPYRLHAVLVHQGEASGGHYWAYVRKRYRELEEQENSKEDTPREEDEGSQVEEPNDVEGEECMVINVGGDEQEEEEDMELDKPQSEHDNSLLVTMAEEGATLSDVIDPSPTKEHDVPPPVNATPTSSTVVGGDWYKCNDISVCEVDWEEVKRESFGRSAVGSTNNTSAYCLVYISDSLACGLDHNEDVVTLNDSLMKYVSDSREAFQKELDDYDLSKTLKETTEDTTSFKKPAKMVRFESSNAEVSSFARQILDTSISPSDAKRARGDTPTNQGLTKDDSLPEREIDPALVVKLRDKVTNMVHSLSAELPNSIKEPRLLSLFHYATDCGFSEKVRQTIILDIVSEEAHVEGDESLCLLAKKEYVSLLKDTSGDLERVKEMYKLLCGVCHHCLQAINWIKKDDWFQALPHVFKSFRMNTKIQEMSNVHCGMKKEMLTQFRSKVVLMVSHKGTACFNSGSFDEGLLIGSTYIVPAIKELTSHAAEGDEDIVETVRGHWCNCLDQGTNEENSEKLGDLIVKIVDGFSKATDIESPPTPQQLDIQMLVAHYSNAFTYLSTEILKQNTV